MTPKRLDLPTAADARTDTWLPLALETLQRGGLVVLPTETVYGVAARADDADALARLAELKGRPEERAFTWHVANSDALLRFGRTTTVAWRLAERYWPGPLTLVLPGVPEGLELVAREGLTGVRCVAGEAASALCAAAPFPLVMSSANAHGQPPAIDAVSTSGLPLEADDLVLDGGAATLGESSTVLLVGGGRFEILREGLHDLDALRRAGGLRLGFACTGNTCRSPMAEGLARDAIATRLECAPQHIENFGFDVRSMGIHAASGSPAAEHAVEVLAGQGIDIRDHRATQATPESVAQFDAVYCLTRGHLAALEQALPPRKAGLLHLLDPDGRDIADPIGGDIALYRGCAEQIADAIAGRLDDWA